MHPHAVTGAIVSLAIIWPLPIIVTFSVSESLAVIEALARQMGNRTDAPLRRYDSKPHRLQSRRLFFLQGLPSVGPALARRLLAQFGSPARAVGGTLAQLAEIRGIGSVKAADIRAFLDE